jgi:hypothetical protein
MLHSGHLNYHLHHKSLFAKSLVWWCFSIHWDKLLERSPSLLFSVFNNHMNEKMFCKRMFIMPVWSLPWFDVEISSYSGIHRLLRKNSCFVIQLFYAFIIEGVDGLSEWVQDPTRPDTTLSWHIISGKCPRFLTWWIFILNIYVFTHALLILFVTDSGYIEQDITKSSSYYVAVGNVYLNEVKVNAEAAYDDIC